MNMRGYHETFTDCFVLSGELLTGYAVGARQILIQPCGCQGGQAEDDQGQGAWGLRRTERGARGL